MDINSLLGTVMSGESVEGLGKAANVSADSTKSILSAALPALLSGALNQSTNTETSQGFENALTQHAAADTSNLSSFLGGVDLADGGKIIAHLLGMNTASTVTQVAQQTGTTEEQTSSVLSAAAPLLMSLLGQTTASQQQANSGLNVASIMGSLLGGNNTASLLTSLLGGGMTAPAAAADTLTEVTDTTAAAQTQEQKKPGILGAILNLLK